MDGKLNVFEALSRRVAWLGQRQRVLAQNIANADTPDYLPRDLKHGPFQKMLGRKLAPAAVSQTHPDHLRLVPRPRPGFPETDLKDSYETARTGNAVVVEEQLVKVADNQTDYQAMTNLYRKHIQMMRTALGKNG